MNERFASRKWVLCLLVIVLTVVARALAWIDGAQFVSMLTWVVGLYMAGNIGSAIAGNITITGSATAKKP